MNTNSENIRRLHFRWLCFFLLFTFALQIALIPDVLQPIRTWLRVAFFGVPLVMFVIPLGKSYPIPLRQFGGGIIAALMLGLVNPESNGALASVATIMLNLAILSPIFWLGRMQIDANGLRSILMLLWAFHACSVVFGVLEVTQPARFSRESQIATTMSGDLAEGLKITLADGTKIYRPMGLTDSPGGASQSGFMVILLGSFFISSNYHPFIRFMLACSIVFGFFCIYLTQVRSALVLIGVCQLSLVAMMLIRNEKAKLSANIAMIGASLVVSTLWALSTGGDEVLNRLTTLWDSDAGTVYYTSRGVFLEETFFSTIPEYPFGAGLGRWGMVYQYFGDRSSQASTSLWAEIQGTAWVYDGGVLLFIIYYCAIFYCIAFAYRAATSRRDMFGELGVLVFAHNIAILALTFSYVPFIGQSGLYYWIINAAYMAVAFNNPSPAPVPIAKST